MCSLLRAAKYVFAIRAWMVELRLTQRPAIEIVIEILARKHMKAMTSGNMHKGQSGVVILEALIAIFIFSIGILGLVGALSTSVTNASEAQYRTDAAFFAETLIGELRVADPATRATDYASPSGGAFDTWKTRLTSGDSALPGASNTANLPTVVFSGTGNRNVVVTINWQAKNSSSTTRQYVVQTALE